MYIKYIHHDRMEFISGLLGWFSIQKRISMFHRFNRVKKENHSNQCRKHIGQNPTPTRFKTCKEKKRNWARLPQLVDEHLQKTYSWHTLVKGWVLYPLDQARMSALTIIKHIGESPSQCSKPRKGNKGPQLRKEETKLLQFLYAMIVSVRNPMEFICTN